MTSGIVHRCGQAWRALRPVPEANEQEMLETWLSPAQQQAFSRLSTHDRAHLIRVASQVVREAPDNHDLVVAALLHDLGKQSGGHRVRLIDRILRVVLDAVAPSLLAWLVAPPAGRFWTGLMLSVHHPQLGADAARRLGCNERICWLIAHHEDPSSSGDADIARLQRIDDATF